MDNFPVDINVADYIQNPAGFRDVLFIETDTGKQRLGDVIDDWQRKDFEAMDAGLLRVSNRAGNAPIRLYLERARGHSKTSDIAVSALWALCCIPRAIHAVVAAADKDQARLVRDAIKVICDSNLWLKDGIDVQSYEVIATHTGSKLEILAGDAASSYGILPDVIIIDELTHWKSKGGDPTQANELWVSLISSAAKRANCLVAIISNAGMNKQACWQWDIRELARTSSEAGKGWHFSRLEGVCASWITEANLDEQRLILPAIAFQRLWLNLWVEGSGDSPFEKRTFQRFTRDATGQFVLADGRTFRSLQCTVFMTSDLAISENNRADYSVLATWLLTPDDDLLLYHLFRDRLIFPKLIEKIRELKKQLQVGDVYVEDVAFQKAVLQQLREHDIYARRFAPQRYGDKVARAQMASVRFNAGLVYFLDGAEWLGTLESELTSFPAGKHDDQVDVVSMAGIIATNFRGAPKVNRLPVGPEELEAMALQAGESSNGNIQTLSLENPKYLIPSEDLHPITKIQERIEYEASGQALIDWLREDSQCPHDWE